jgi:hypothetical protein
MSYSNSALFVGVASLMVLGRAIATPPWIRAVVVVVVVLLETRRVFNSLFRFPARGCARERRPRIIRCCCASGRPSATERLIRCLVAQALGIRLKLRRGACACRPIHKPARGRPRLPDSDDCGSLGGADSAPASCPLFRETRSERLRLQLAWNAEAYRAASGRSVQARSRRSRTTRARRHRRGVRTARISASVWDL